MVRPDGGGGGGDYSSIKFAGMSSLVSQVTSAGSTLQETSKSLQSQASACSVSCPAFSQITEIGSWAEDQVSGLQRRLTLAEAMQSAPGNGSQLSEWTISEPPSMTAAEAEAKGRSIAKKITDHPYTDQTTVDNIHFAAGELRSYSNDPDVLSAFYAQLGLQETQSLPDLLKASGGDNSGTQGAEDMKVFSQSFAGAMKDSSPPTGFTEIKDEFTQPLDKKYTATSWQRLAFMQDGDFPSQYLAQVVRANGLENYAKDGYDQDYRGGGLGGLSLGMPCDNVAMMFRALKNNPAAARVALDGLDLNNVVKTTYGTEGSLGTGDEIVPEFAAAMKAATGTNDESMGAHTPGASEFTFNFMRASGAVGDVPDQMQGALGQIGASYAPELLSGAENKDAATRESGMTKPQDFQNLPGVNPAFYLTQKDTYRFIHGFGGNESYSKPFDDAVGTIYDDALGKAAVEKKAHPDSEAWNRTLGRFGQLAGLEYAAQKDVRGDMDESDKQMRELLGKVVSFGVGKVPTPQGLAAQVGWKVASYAIGKGIEHFQSGDPEKTRVAMLDNEDLKASFLVHYNLAHTLQGAKYPGMENAPAELLNGKELKSPSEIADDPKLFAAYSRWTDTTDQNKSSDMDNLLDDGDLIFKGGKSDSENETTKYGY